MINLSLFILIYCIGKTAETLFSAVFPFPVDWQDFSRNPIYIGKRGVVMLLELLSAIGSNMLYLLLHIEGAGSFPKPLSAKEERAALERFAAGDMAARDELIEHNLRLVAHIIKKYYSNYADQDDLISIGTIGLIKGINTFNGARGTRLATYAARCIENSILSQRLFLSVNSTKVFFLRQIFSNGNCS